MVRGSGWLRASTDGAGRLCAIPPPSTSGKPPPARWSTSCLEGLDHKTYRIHKLCVDEQQRVVPLCQMDYPGVESAIRRATIMQPTIVVIVFPVNAIILVAAQLFVKHPLSQILVKNPVVA